MDSSDAIADFWTHFGKDKPYFDADHVIDVSHGCRTFDMIALYAPDFAIPEYVTELEKTIPDVFGGKAREIPGSIKLVNDLLKLEEIEEKQRMAVVTSGTPYMATKWFQILGLTKPEVFITSASVTQGKPHPEPYLLGREGLGYTDASRKVIVFEDAPAGIKSGKDAGCFVIGIASTLTAEELKNHGADLVVPDLLGITVGNIDQESDTLQLIISDYHHISEERLREFGL